MPDLPYFQIPDQPNEVSSTNVIARFIDGLGFRYRWATEGLTANEVEFRVQADSMSMLEVIDHIYDLALMVHRAFGLGTVNEPRPDSFETLRTSTLTLYVTISNHLKAMPDTDLNTEGKVPFWYFLNGPIADSLTHVGQITSWRRIAGNPQPKGVNLFYGTKS